MKENYISIDWQMMNATILLSRDNIFIIFSLLVLNNSTFFPSHPYTITICVMENCGSITNP